MIHPDTLGEVQLEAMRASDLHGNQGHLPDLGDQGRAFLRNQFPTASRARWECERASTVKDPSWALIFAEEVCEVIEAVLLGDVEHVREELIQVAATAGKWVDAIDGRGQQGAAA